MAAYYIDTAGSAGNNGTSISTPVDSFATLLGKGYTFADYDEFYFARNQQHTIGNGSAPTSAAQALLTIRPIVKMWAGLGNAPNGMYPKLIMNKAHATFYFAFTSATGLYSENVDWYWVVDGNTYSGTATGATLNSNTSAFNSHFFSTFNFVKTGSSNKTVAHSYQISANTGSISQNLYTACGFFDRNDVETYNVQDTTPWDNGYTKGVLLGLSAQLIGCFAFLQINQSSSNIGFTIRSMIKTTFIYWAKWTTNNGYCFDLRDTGSTGNSYIGNTFINMEDLNTSTTNKRYVLRYNSSQQTGNALNNLFLSARNASGGYQSNYTLTAFGDGTNTTATNILNIGGNIWVGHRLKEVTHLTSFGSQDLEYNYTSSGQSSNYFSAYVNDAISGDIFNLNRSWFYTGSFVLLLGRARIPAIQTTNSAGSINRSSTNPQISSILNGYNQKGSEVWFPDYPATSDVKLSTVYNFGQSTGTYDPNIPAASDVRYGVAVGVTTGTARIPAATDVRSGTLVDATTGTLAVPSAANVRQGTSVDATTGTLKVPSPSDVRSGVQTDATTGTLDLPAVGNVRAGTTFDGGTKTGLLDLPAASDVRKGVTFDQATKTGTVKLPAVGKVSTTESYGAGDTEYTGTRTDALASNVKTGSGQYGAGGTEFTPSYSPDFPDRANVAPDDTVDGLSGTMDLPTLDHVSPNDTLRGNTGTQDLPSLSSIRADDTLEGVNGTLPLNKLPPSLGGTYLGEESNTVVTSSQLVSTATITNRGVSVTGNQVVPSAGNVRQGTNTGTTTGTLKVPTPSQVVSGVPTDNTVGTLDVDVAANLPDPTDVLVGSGAYGKNLDIIPSYSPDFPDRANVTEDDTVNGQSGLLPLDKVAPSQGGTYLGEESNNPIPNNKVVSGYEYLILGVTDTGTASAATGSFPQPGQVLDGVDRGDGVLGTFGHISTDPGMDISEQIAGNIVNLISNYLPGWSPAEYLLDPTKNNFKTNNKRYGVLIGELNEADQILGQETLAREYTIRLLKRYTAQGPTDKQIRMTGDELRTIMEELRRRGVATNFGNLTNIMDVRDFTEAEVSYDENHEFCQCDLTLTIIYTVDKQ